MGLAGRERLDRFTIESVNAKVESEMSDKLFTTSSLQSSVASLESGLTRVLEVGWRYIAVTNRSLVIQVSVDQLVDYACRNPRN